jgi:tetratricopeptide (TPR) repeat protein
VIANSARLLNPAIGYFQLGMATEACEELHALPAEIQNLPEVIALRAEIYTHAAAWDSLREMAAGLVASAPGSSQNWIWLAYATRRCRSIEEAERLLLKARELHPAEPMIHFNLACYAAQTGFLENARAHLDHAITLDPSIRQQALEDDDLLPLWAAVKVA